jgi:hypothetical protein
MALALGIGGRIYWILDNFKKTGLSAHQNLAAARINIWVCEWGGVKINPQCQP